MSEPISINETRETTSKLSREKKELPIVIINGKKYAECCKGKYYMSLEEQKKIGERLIENTTELVEIFAYRIYRINPEGDKFEGGGYIRYAENLDKINENQSYWIGADAKVCDRTTVVHEDKSVNGTTFINSQSSMAQSQNLSRATDEISENIEKYKEKNPPLNFGN